MFNFIHSFLPTSFIDWEGKVSTIIFTSGCNFKCLFCHNHELIEVKKQPEENFYKLYSYLKENRDFLSGIVISGGEPLLHKDIEKFIEKLKNDFNLPIKLDTNASLIHKFPNIIKLVDLFAIDLKATKEDWEKLTNFRDIDKIFDNIKFLLKNNCKVQLRTTVLPKITTFEKLPTLAETIEKNFPNIVEWKLQLFKPDNAFDENWRTFKSPDKQKIEEIVKTLKTSFKIKLELR